MTIDLIQGQSIDLTKSSSETLTAVRLGLGWDALERTRKGLFGQIRRVQGSIDLDASALLIGGGEVREVVDFSDLESANGSVSHHGDNLTGDGDGDDESISVDLIRVQQEIEHIVFIVNSFSGQSFHEVSGAFVRVLDPTDGNTELARYSLADFGDHTAVIMARISRTGTGWSFTAIGEPADAQMATSLGPMVLAML